MVDTVKTVKSAGGDYSSLSGWEAGQQKVIASGDTEQAECYSFNDTTQCVINGWTTAADAYIRTYTPAAERHAGVWNTAKYYLSASPTAAGVLTITEEFVRVEGLQVSSGYASNSTESAIRINHTGTSSDVRIEATILRHTSTGRYVLRDDSTGSGATLTVRNCLLYGGSAGGAAIVPGAASVATLDNCDFIGGTYGINRAGGTVTCRNTYARGTTAAYQGTITKTTAASSDTTGSAGLQSIAYSTANFTNVTAGSEDLHLVSGSALIDVGTDLSASFTTDIDGVTRSGTWDIGADEYVAGGGGTVTHLIGGSLCNSRLTRSILI